MWGVGHRTVEVLQDRVRREERSEIGPADQVGADLEAVVLVGVAGVAETDEVVLDEARNEDVVGRDDRDGDVLGDADRIEVVGAEGREDVAARRAVVPELGGRIDEKVLGGDAVDEEFNKQSGAIGVDGLGADVDGNTREVGEVVPDGDHVREGDPIGSGDDIGFERDRVQRIQDAHDGRAVRGEAGERERPADAVRVDVESLAIAPADRGDVGGGAGGEGGPGETAVRGDTQDTAPAANEEDIAGGEGGGEEISG